MILFVIGAVVIIFFAISIIKAQIEINEKNEILASDTEVYESRLSENEALESALSEGATPEQMEQEARKDRYVMKGERVYVEDTPGSEE